LAHGARGYLDVSIDSDPTTNKSVIAYTFEDKRADGVTSYGRMFFRVLDQNLGPLSKDSLAADKLPNQMFIPTGALLTWCIILI
jgi:hypothetical protein